MTGHHQTEEAVIPPDVTKNIIRINDAFLNIKGYIFIWSNRQKHRPVLQGENTSKETIELICKSLMRKQFIETQILRYRKSEESCLCRFVITSVINNGKILTNYIAFEVAEI